MWRRSPRHSIYILQWFRRSHAPPPQTAAQGASSSDLSEVWRCFMWQFWDGALALKQKSNFAEDTPASHVHHADIAAVSLSSTPAAWLTSLCEPQETFSLMKVPVPAPSADCGFTLFQLNYFAITSVIISLVSSTWKQPSSLPVTLFSSDPGSMCPYTELTWAPVMDCSVPSIVWPPSGTSLHSWITVYFKRWCEDLWTVPTVKYMSNILNVIIHWAVPWMCVRRMKNKHLHMFLYFLWILL